MLILHVSFAFSDINTIKLTDNLCLLLWNKRIKQKATISNKSVNILINHKISHDTGTQADTVITALYCDILNTLHLNVT